MLLEARIHLVLTGIEVTDFYILSKTAPLLIHIFGLNDTLCIPLRLTAVSYLISRKFICSQNLPVSYYGRG